MVTGFPFVYNWLSNSAFKVVATLILLVLAYYSKSNAAFIALFFYGIGFTFYEIYSARNTFKKGIIASFALGALLLLSFSSVGIKQLESFKTIYFKTTHFIETGELIGPARLSVSKRIVTYNNALSALKEKPWFGVGAGEIGSPAYQSDSKNYISPHFFFLEPLFDTGLVGFCFFLFSQFSLICALLLKTIRFRNAPAYISAFLGLIGFWISSIGMSSGIYFLPFYILLAITSFIAFSKKIESQIKIMACFEQPKSGW
jgi:O-antigen ligase